MTVRQVAEYLNVDAKVIYRLVQAGELPGFKVARAWRFKRADIEAWIEEQKKRSAMASNFTSKNHKLGIINIMKILALKNDKSKPSYTSRLQKGGALLNDMRLLVRHWSDEVSYNEQRQKILIENILGKRTRTRATDIFRRVFCQRFLKGDPPESWKILRPLEDREASLEIIKPIYFWTTSRSEKLMYDFVTEYLCQRSKSLDLSIRLDEIKLWLKKNLADRRRIWSEAVTLRVGRGLLAALRDFGILEGKLTKKITYPYLPSESFAYIAFVLFTLKNTGERLINHPDWRLFFLSPSEVERFFLEAHQKHFLRYDAAGRIYRIEFAAQSFEEMADVILGRRV